MFLKGIAYDVVRVDNPTVAYNVKWFHGYWSEDRQVKYTQISGQNFLVCFDESMLGLYYLFTVDPQFISKLIKSKLSNIKRED